MAGNGVNTDHLTGENESKKSVGRPNRLKLYVIRNRIQESLQKRPMGLFELSQDVDTTIPAVRRQLEYLIKLGIINKSEYMDVSKSKALYSLRQR